MRIEKSWRSNIFWIQIISPNQQLFIAEDLKQFPIFYFIFIYNELDLFSNKLKIFTPKFNFISTIALDSFSFGRIFGFLAEY